jgi:hypothetical protein
MIRIKLSDGSTIDVPHREPYPDALMPSKRQNKNKSGRTGRRQYNANQTIRRVGGIANDTKAIYYGYDNGTTNYAPLCVVVSKNKHFTDSPQQSSPSAGGKATS